MWDQPDLQIEVLEEFIEVAGYQAFQFAGQLEGVELQNHGAPQSWEALVALKARHKKWINIKKQRLIQAKEANPRSCPLCKGDMTFHRRTAQFCSRRCYRKRRYQCQKQSSTRSPRVRTKAST